MPGLVGDLLSRGATALGETLAKDVREQAGIGGREVTESLGLSASHYLRSTEEGQAIEKLIQDTHRTSVQLTSQLDAPRQELLKGLKKDPSLLKYGKANLQDIHNDLAAKGSPLTQHSGQLLQRNPNAAGMTLDELGFEHEAQGRLSARVQHMGANFENVSPLIMALRDSSDPRRVQLGQIYGDILNSELRDTETITSFAKDEVPKGPESQAKAAMNKAFSVSNKIRKVIGDEPTPLLTTDPIYTNPTTIEKTVDKVLHVTQAPFAAVSHLMMEANLMLKGPTRSYIRSILGTNKAESRRIIEASGMLGFQDLDAMSHDYLGRTGRLAQWTKSPTLGNILTKGYDMPGLRQLRRLQIRHAGAVGFESAHQWAEQMMKGSKSAEEYLREMRIDPGEVRARGGQLTDEELTRAVYHFADKTMFIKGNMNMPLRANKDILRRSMNMYHYFVRNQTEFMAKEFYNMAKTGDTASLGRAIAVMAGLFPAIAPLLKGSQVLLRTGSPSQAADPIRKFYAPESGAEWAQAYTEGIAEMWGWGMANYYMDSIKSQRLWTVALGSKLSTPINYTGDLLGMAAGRSPVPFERDVLQSIPAVGKPISHWLVPGGRQSTTGFSPHRKLGGRRRRKL